MTIHIIQPAIPAYRICFFKNLQKEFKKQDENIMVYAAIRDHLGVESVESSGFNYSLESNIKSLFGGNVLWQTRVKCKFKKGDVLVIDGNPRWINNYSLILYAKINNIPVLWWGQGWAVGSYGTFANIRQHIMRIADGVVLYTDKECLDYVNIGFNSKSTFALNNGLDIEKIDHIICSWDLTRLNKFRDGNGINKCLFWCLFIGRLSKKSEIMLLIKAMSEVNNDIGLIVVGDGPFAEDAKSYSSSLGLQHRIIWAGPIFEESEVAPWMLSASAFVYPGAVGLSLIHGFSYGLPAIVHNDYVWHNPEYAAFENYGNGIAFQRGSFKSLASAIELLIRDECAQKKMSNKAISLVHETYNIRDMVKRFVEAVNMVRD